jgi:hypothetical protein
MLITNYERSKLRGDIPMEIGCVWRIKSIIRREGITKENINLRKLLVLAVKAARISKTLLRWDSYPQYEELTENEITGLIELNTRLMSIEDYIRKQYAKFSSKQILHDVDQAFQRIEFNFDIMFCLKTNDSECCDEGYNVVAEYRGKVYIRNFEILKKTPFSIQSYQDNHPVNNIQHCELFIFLCYKAGYMSLRDLLRIGKIVVHFNSGCKYTYENDI